MKSVISKARSVAGAVDERLRAVLGHELTGWLFVALGVLLRVRQFVSNRSLWLDEAALALIIRNGTFAEDFAPVMPNNQAAPVGFLALVRVLWRLLGDTDYAIRVVPFVAGLATLFLMRDVARRLLSPPFAHLAIALAAISPSLLRYSDEFKQYGIDSCLALAMVALILRALPGPLTARHTVAVALSGAVMIWFAHAIVFVLVACGAALVADAAVRRDRRAFIRVSMIGLAWVASFAIAYVTHLAAKSQSSALLDFHAFAMLPVQAPLIEWLVWLKQRLLHAMNSPGGLHPTWLGLLAVTAGFWAIGRKGLAVLLLVALPLLVVLGGAIVRRYPFEGRFIVFLLPFLLLGASAAMQALSERAGRWLPGAWLALGIALSLVSAKTTAQRFVTPFTIQETRPLFEELAAERRPGDAIVVYYGAVAAFDHYAPRYGLDGAHVIRFEGWRRGWAVYEKSLAQAPPEGRVWLVLAHNHKDEFDRIRAYYAERRPTLIEREGKDVGLFLYDRVTVSPPAADTGR